MMEMLRLQRANPTTGSRSLARAQWLAYLTSPFDHHLTTVHVRHRYKDIEFLQHRIIGNGEQGDPWHMFPHLGAAPKLPCHDSSKVKLV